MPQRSVEMACASCARHGCRVSQSQASTNSNVDSSRSLLYKLRKRLSAAYHIAFASRGKQPAASGGNYIFERCLQ